MADGGDASRTLPTLPGRVGPPVLSDRVVPRERLIKALVDHGDATLVVVRAPAGYGKSTTLALWDRTDPRPFAWVQLGRSDDDPVRLVRHVAAALDAARPIARDTHDALRRPGGRVDLDLLPALLAELDRGDDEVLVLDDVHTVTSPGSIEVITALLDHRGARRTVVLAGRSTERLHLARHLVGDAALVLGPPDLAMDDLEAAELLDHAGVRLDDTALTDVVRRTEGWPAGLHLVALGSGGLQPVAGEIDQRLLVDYLVEEVLDALPPERAEFLLTSSVLDRMSGDLLDDLLERHDSADQLRALERDGNQFLVRLDTSGTWYRYHHLFGEVLRSLHVARDRRTALALDRRASVLLAERGDLDGAIDHAVAAGDQARAADLVLAEVPALVLSGRAELLGVRLATIGSDSATHQAAAALAWAWYGSIVADPTLFQHGLACATRFADTGPLADGSPSLTAAVAMLQAMTGRDGLDSVARLARVVRESGGPEVNPWWATAAATEGTACSMLGQLDEARRCFDHALAAAGEAPMLEAIVRGHLALLDLYEDDLVSAERGADAACALVERHRLLLALPAVMVYPIGAVVAARLRRGDDARERIALGRAALARLGDLSARSVLLGSVLLARAALLSGDRAGARALCVDAQRARRREPGALFVNEQLDVLTELLDDDAPAGGGPITLAELRVLQYLPTHLSVQAIAEKLYISRNTAKSHCQSIYRKLGVSSRDAAVDEARRQGILV